MITPAHAQMMAAYNAWQNESLYDTASALDDVARRADHGAFFGSIHRTLNHVLWGDRIWLSRFTDYPAPEGGIPDSTDNYEDWGALRSARGETDAFLRNWAGALSPADLEGDLTWFSGAMGRDVTKPRWVLVTHLFNHQTHHRGQVHAMLTAAGAKPDDTDIPFMPDRFNS